MSSSQEPNACMTAIATGKTVNTVPLEAANTSPGLNTSDTTDTDVEPIHVHDKQPWPTVKDFDSIYEDFLSRRETKVEKEITLCMYTYRSNLYPSHLPVDVALVAFQEHICKLENSQKKSSLAWHAKMVWNCLLWFQRKQEKEGYQIQSPIHFKAQVNRELIGNTQPQEPITISNKATTTDYIDEPLDEYAQIYDFATGKQLICTNKHNIESSCWLSKFKTAASEDKLLNLKQQINVAKEAIPFLSSSEPFSHDDHMVYSSDLEATCKVIVHYSTYVHILLNTHNENVLIISCLRGRSRSPCVILCFLILFRGFNTQHAINFLSTAFRQQRPTMALLSSKQQKNFPNLSKYLNVCNHLEKAKLQLTKGNASENNWLRQAIIEVWEAFLQHAPHMQKNKDIISPMASLKLTFEAQWQKSLSKLKYDCSGSSNSTANGRNESSLVGVVRSRINYINCIKCSVPNVRDSGVFFPTKEIGFNMQNFNTYGNSCMHLCDQLKRNSLMFKEVIPPSLDEKNRAAPSAKKTLISAGKMKSKVASDTKTKKRKKSAAKQPGSTGQSSSVAKKKRSKTESSLLPSVESTLKAYRSYFGSEDFRSKIKFPVPGSNLPLPWMYAYLSVRGSFRAALGNGEKISGGASKFADVYWHFDVKPTPKRFRSLVEIKKYLMGSKHKGLLKDNGLFLMFNNRACMKLKCCVLHCVGSKPIHPYSAQYKMLSQAQKNKNDIFSDKDKAKRRAEPIAVKGKKQIENKRVSNGRLTNHVEKSISPQNAIIAEHDGRYASFARKYLEELSIDEVREIKNGDYVYAFYPGTKIKDRKYDRYKILANVKACSSDNALLKKNTMDRWGMKLLWEPKFKSSRINRIQFLVQQIKPAKLRPPFEKLPPYDHNSHKQTSQCSKTTTLPAKTNESNSMSSSSSSDTLHLNHDMMMKDSMNLSRMFCDDIIAIPLAHSGVDL